MIYMSNRKFMIFHIIVVLIKGYYYTKMSYFPPYGHSKIEIKVEWDLRNCATKSDLKNASGVDTSQFAKKDDLSNLKSEVDELDVAK